MEPQTAFNANPSYIFEYLWYAGSRRIQPADVCMVPHLYAWNDYWIIITIQRYRITVIERNELDPKTVQPVNIIESSPKELMILKKFDDSRGQGFEGDALELQR